MLGRHTQAGTPGSPCTTHQASCASVQLLLIQQGLQDSDSQDSVHWYKHVPGQKACRPDQCSQLLLLPMVQYGCIIADSYAVRHARGGEAKHASCQTGDSCHGEQGHKQ